MSALVDYPEDYFRALVPSRDALLRELEEEAAAEGIPIVGPVVGQLLQILALFAGAERILELGTATGYSGLYLARACKERGGSLLTLESDPRLAERARSTFRRDGAQNRVQVMEAEGVRAMRDMEADSFDLAFLDIDKESYEPALDQLSRVVRRFGLLVADNTGFSESSDFNRVIQNDPRWRCVQLLTFLPEHSPEYDGLCLAVRQGEPRMGPR
jgi:predicted O-methyltransferase YrrM